jgi:hypothetical protein
VLQEPGMQEVGSKQWGGGTVGCRGRGHGTRDRREGTADRVGQQAICKGCSRRLSQGGGGGGEQKGVGGGVGGGWVGRGGGVRRERGRWGRPRGGDVCVQGGGRGGWGVEPSSKSRRG